MSIETPADHLRKAGAVCGVLVCAVGVSALAGWVLHNESLKGLHAGISMKANTALCLLCLGVSLLLLRPPRRSTWRTRLGRGLALMAAVIGLATLTEHLFGWDLGIDQILFREPAGLPATLSPNRMGPPASICFPLLGMALFWIDRRTPQDRVLSHWLAFLPVVIALIPVLGYVFDVDQLYGIARFTGIALHTAVSFMLLGLGILLARADAGAMRLLIARESGGMLLRRMLPAAILLPIILGWLRVRGQEAGLYDLEFGRSLLILSFILAFSILTWWTAMVVERHSTAQQRAEAEESRMKEQLVRSLESERAARAIAERSNQMKDEFLATLSHELRTPLSAIQGWAQVLVQGGVPEEDSRRGLEAIERNARLQAKLIEDLLDMSRIDAGKVHLDLQQVDLALMIEAVLATAAPSIRAKGIRVERMIDPWVGPVRGDPARLQQVLWNLVANAIKFTPADGRLIVSLTNVGSNVELAVRDNGVGISREFLGQVFDRFRQADSSTTRRHGGLGLGLSIAQQLTELHGGTLRAESPGKGQGATFTIQLPRPAASILESDGRRPPLHESPSENGWPSLDGVRVLVVDDQPDSCELIERILRSHGAEVSTAGDVERALQLFDGGSFGLLISDIGMPERDGYDLIREIRRRGAAIPAMALTAFARVEDEQAALASGYQRHLPKPIEANHLVKEVAILLAQSFR